MNLDVFAPMTLPSFVTFAFFCGNFGFRISDFGFPAGPAALRACLRSLLLAAALGAVASSTAQPSGSPSPLSPLPSPLGGGPHIEFDSTHLDFGRIPAGQLIKHDFVFTNTGNQVLEIKDVRPTCGCTLVRTWEPRIQPGQRGVIAVQLDSTEFTGTIFKTVIVLCNDPVRTNVVLELEGKAWRPIEITPEGAGFAVSSDSPTNQTRVVRIVSNLDAPLKLSKPACTNRAFQTTLETVRPGKEFELKVTFLRSRFMKHVPNAATNVTAPIVLKTSSANVPAITIPARAMVVPAVLPMPAEIGLPPGPLTRPAQYSLMVRNYGTKPLALLKAVGSVPGIDVRVGEPQPGRAFVLIVGFPEGFQIKRGQKVELRVKTNHPQYPVLKLPIFQNELPAEALNDRSSSPQTAGRSSKAPIADGKK